MVRCIGLDAATVTGYAWRSREGVWVTGTLRLFEQQATLAELLTLAANDGVTLAVIEEPYLGAHFNVNTLRVLIRAQALCEAECRHVGLETRTVFASAWQRYFRLDGQRADRKAGSMRIAKMLGADVGRQDEADAVCLAEYGQRMPEPPAQAKMAYRY